jgi:hypothetical protein
MDEADEIKLQNIELENMKLQSENAFLLGKIEVYENFLARKGLLNDTDKTRINILGGEL